jgi:hypothetical protein
MAHASRIKIFRSGDTFRPSALMPNGAAGEWVTMATFTDELSAERFVTSIIEKGN